MGIRRTAIRMTETICRSCGSEQLDVTKICDFCNQALYLTCNRCGYISDEKVHVDCIRRVEVLIDQDRDPAIGRQFAQDPADGALPVDHAVAGTAADPITIRASGTNGNVAATSDRSDNRDSIFVSYCSYIVLEGLRAFNGNRAAVRVDHSDHVVIRNYEGKVFEYPELNERTSVPPSLTEIGAAAAITVTDARGKDNGHDSETVV